MIMPDGMKVKQHVFTSRFFELRDLARPRRHTAKWRAFGHGSKYRETGASFEFLGPFIMMI